MDLSQELVVRKSLCSVRSNGEKSNSEQFVAVGKSPRYSWGFSLVHKFE